MAIVVRLRLSPFFCVGIVEIHHVFAVETEARNFDPQFSPPSLSSGVCALDDDDKSLIRSLVIAPHYLLAISPRQVRATGPSPPSSLLLGAERRVRDACRVWERERQRSIHSALAISCGKMSSARLLLEKR